MRSRLYRSIATLAATSAAVVAVVFAGDVARATASVPPWEPDPGAVGTITFYDASGSVITSGSSSASPMFAYAVGSTTLRAGDTQATVNAANPNPSALPGNWFVDQLGGFSAYPLSSGPANIQALSQTHPVATGVTGDSTLDDFYAESVHYTGTGYTDMIQLRLITANSGGAQGLAYDDADVLVDPDAHTFQVQYPAAANAPDAPTAVHGTAGDGAVTVAWTAPAVDGGAAITGYDIQYSANDGSTWTSASSTFHSNTATSHSVTGLTNGTTYAFRVAAINSVGTGAYSTASGPVVPVADSSSLAISAPTSVKYNASATVAAKLTDAKTHGNLAAQHVSLYKRAGSTKPWAIVKTLTTSASGAASTAVTLTANAQFEWRFAGTSTHKAATSAIKSVTASQVVSAARSASSIAHGKTVTIYGTVLPSGSGQKVYLQQVVKGKWTTRTSATIKKQRLPNGKTTVGFLLAVKLSTRATYTFRVYKPATTTLAAGYSASVTVKAT